jgi:predicted RNA-binding Zn-ribbon protein involved in translation (DUF1610 family)
MPGSSSPQSGRATPNVIPLAAAFECVHTPINPVESPGSSLSGARRHVIEASPMKLTCTSCGASHVVRDDEVRDRSALEFECETCGENNVVDLEVSREPERGAAEPDERRGGLEQAPPRDEEEAAPPGEPDRSEAATEEEALGANGEGPGGDDDGPGDDATTEEPEERAGDDAAAPEEPEEKATAPKSEWTGARNEDSALFASSLLRSVASSPAPRVSTSSPPDSETSMERLMDLRAIAAEAEKMDAARSKGDDDIVDLKGAGGFDDLGGVSPVSIAQPAASQGKLVPILVSGFIVLLVVTVGLGAILYWSNTRQPLREVVVVERFVEPDGAIEPQESKNAPTRPVASEGREAGPPAKADEPDAAGGGKGPAKADPLEPGKRPQGPTPAASDAAEAAPTGPATETPAADGELASPPAPPVQTPAPPAPDDTVGNAVQEALEQPDQQPEKQAEAVDPSLPESPSAAQIKTVMSGLSSRVRNCSDGATGTITVDVTVSGPTGRVTAATVTGQFTGTPVGSCAARLVRSARFPQFRQPSFSFRYPFPI